jgi:hypothetical protein
VGNGQLGGFKRWWMFSEGRNGLKGEKREKDQRK